MVTRPMTSWYTERSGPRPDMFGHNTSKTAGERLSCNGAPIGNSIWALVTWWMMSRDPLSTPNGDGGCGLWLPFLVYSSRYQMPVVPVVTKHWNTGKYSDIIANLRQVAILNFVTTHIHAKLFPSYWQNTTELLQGEDFSVCGSDLELWPWPIKS